MTHLFSLFRRRIFEWYVESWLDGGGRFCITRSFAVRGHSFSRGDGLDCHVTDGGGLPGLVLGLAHVVTAVLR